MTVPAALAPPDLTKIKSGSLPAGTAPTYRPLLPGGRRRWIFPAHIEVLDPHWDYQAGRYAGRLADGRAWDDGGAAMTPSLAWHVCSQIRGYCRPAQGRRLYALAAQAGGAIVEIGAAEGLSACWIGLAARDHGSQLTCVDTFRGPAGRPWRTSIRDRFDANMDYAGLIGTVTAIEATSARAAASYQPGPVGMLHIDAFHAYAAVRHDFLAWGQHVVPGGVICFDDCTADYPGVMRLQTELAADPRLAFAGRTDALVWWTVQKPLR